MPTKPTKKTAAKTTPAKRAGAPKAATRAPALSDVMAQLESWGSEPVRRRNAKHGAGENQFGVLLGKVRGLAEELGTNHTLGLELWATGNADAQMLAVMVMDPAQVTERHAEAMLKPLTYIALIDALVYRLLSRTPAARALEARWMEAENELLARSGWRLRMIRIGNGDTEGLDLDAILDRVHRELPAAPYVVKEAMNYCLVKIGLEVPALRQKAIAIGERLGRWDPRPVPKGCTSSYAPEWIAAVLKRK